MAAEDLYNQAEALRAACETLLGDRAPEVSFVSPGLPVFDCCPMLAVHVPSIGEAGTSPFGALDTGHRYEMGRVNLSNLIVSIVRCDQETQAGELPDVSGKEATALGVLTDAWTLWNGLSRMTADGTLFRGCGERFFDGARAINPQGNCVGYLLSFRISLPGYDLTEPTT